MPPWPNVPVPATSTCAKSRGAYQSAEQRRAGPERARRCETRSRSVWRVMGAETTRDVCHAYMPHVGSDASPALLVQWRRFFLRPVPTLHRISSRSCSKEDAYFPQPNAHPILTNISPTFETKYHQIPSKFSMPKNHCAGRVTLILCYKYEKQGETSGEPPKHFSTHTLFTFSPSAAFVEFGCGNSS